MAKAARKIVKTTCGFLQGQRLESIRGTPYFSFQGIPYAKPPVGPLRFKSPQPPETWQGVRDALKEGASAPSYHMLTQQYLEQSSEDCLFLNVYTTKPEKSTDVLKPVMFFIHGGGFNTGSGDTDLYGPDLLLAEDVVVVTCNYRLGVLGFLSLQTPECPGNNGLKDIVAALTWVQKNISEFGGNPKNVTIFGESAGGAAVQYLMLSNLGKGLFHRAISQSGVPLNPWACSRKPREYAFKLAERLGFKAKDDKELLEFLQTANPKAIVQKSLKGLNEVEPNEHFIRIPFVPTVEPQTPGAFFTRHPAELLEAGEVLDVPYLLGSNSLEGLIALRIGTKVADMPNNGFTLSKLVPNELQLDPSSSLSKEIAERIKQFYFKDGFQELNLVNALSAVYFVHGVDRTVEYLRRLKNRKSNTFVYNFDFNSDLGLKQFYECDLKGAVHTDELTYLFAQPLLGKELSPGTPEHLTMERMTRMWADFAKFGDPTPNSRLWRPVQGDKVFTLHIAEELKLKEGVSEQFTFWREVDQMATAARSKL